MFDTSTELGRVMTQTKVLLGTTAVVGALVVGQAVYGLIFDRPGSSSGLAGPLVFVQFFTLLILYRFVRWARQADTDTDEG